MALKLGVESLEWFLALSQYDQHSKVGNGHVLHNPQKLLSEKVKKWSLLVLMIMLHYLGTTN